MADNNDIDKIIAALASRGASVVQVGGERPDKPADGWPVAMQARRLKDHYDDLIKEYEFRPGMLVMLKPGLESHMKIPNAGQPAIVTKVFDKPIHDPRAENGNPDFGREFHMTLMALVDGRTIEFAYDKRLFQPYTGEIA